MSNQLDYLSRVQEITHVNGASLDKRATVTATDPQPGPILEVLLPSYQAQFGPGFSSNDSCTSLEDNNLLQPSLASIENAEPPTRDDIYAKSDMQSQSNNPLYQPGLPVRPRSLQFNPSDVDKHQAVNKRNDLSRDSSLQNYSYDEKNLNLYSLDPNQRQVPVGNSLPDNQPFLIPKNENPVQTNNNIYATPVENNLLHEDNNKNDSIAAVKESFKLKSNSSVEFEDGMER